MTYAIYAITVVDDKHDISVTYGKDKTMGNNKITDILRPARRGSKRHWKAVTFELPPEEHDRLLAFVARDGRRRTDIAAEAMLEYLDRRAA